MDIQVSIIVPVYNAEKYIEKCIKSLINQSFKNIEIIIINDGSKDNSELICDNLKVNDKRIKLFTIDNNGVSNARNLGITKSTGKYIAFVDADDFVDTNFIENLYTACEINNADIAMCNFYSHYGFYRRKSAFSNMNTIYNSKINDFLFDKKCNIIKTVSCKLIKTSIIKDNLLKFDNELSQGEDHLFFLECFINATKICSIMDKYLYYYRKNIQTSATRSDYCGSWLSNEKILLKTFKILDKYKIILSENEKNELINNKLNASINVLVIKNDYKTFYKRINTMNKESTIFNYKDRFRDLYLTDYNKIRQKNYK